MPTVEEKPPKCLCGAEKLFDPFVSVYYCKECDPKYHLEVLADIREEKARKIREEYQNTVEDNI